jgi:TonB family protein
MTTTPPGTPEPNIPAALPGDLQPAGPGGAGVRFLFDHQPTPLGGAIGPRNTVIASILTHLGILALIILIGRLLPHRVYETILPDRLSNQIVWLAEPGPGGGGGGGGNKSPDPPKQAELPGKEKISVPVVKPPEPKPDPTPPKPEPDVAIPAQTAAAAPVEAPGVIDSTQAENKSQGAGTNNGAGTGNGLGIGPGEGSGLGPGRGGGVGGGVYRPGNGVVLPRVLQEVRPAYTAEAMRAKVQGTVLLECVVLPDGTVGNVDVQKSLDSTFGLDQEAIKAAKRWRFAPGTRFGEPVAVLVTIELTFTLR